MSKTNLLSKVVDIDGAWELDVVRNIDWIPRVTAHIDMWPVLQQRVDGVDDALEEIDSILASS